VKRYNGVRVPKIPKQKAKIETDPNTGVDLLPKTIK